MHTDVRGISLLCIVFLRLMPMKYMHSAASGQQIHYANPYQTYIYIKS